MRPVRLIATLLLALGSLALPAHADDHYPGAITGVVTDVDGEPLEDICVSAYHLWYEYPSETARTDEDGTYTIYELYPDDYLLRFRDCSDDPRYSTEWFDDAASRADADEVRVESDVFTQADAVLEEGGSIAGHVSTADGRDIAFACVSAADADGETVATAETNHRGAYVVGGLRPGAYRVRFGRCEQEPIFYARSVSSSPDVSPTTTSSTGPAAYADDYLSEWYDDVDSFEEAMPVGVTTGDVTAGIDAQLTLGGWITGVVTDAAQEPFLHACVTAYGTNGEWLSYTTTDEGGYYRLRGLDAGSYKVQFSDCHSYRHRTEWYDDVLSQGLATPLTVTLGQEVSGANASLALRPMADIAVTGLQVQTVPIETDAASLGVGIHRDVHVEVSNLGSKEAHYVGLTVWVRMQDGTSKTIGRERWWDISAGDSWRRTFRWDTKGFVGDAEVHAEVCTYSEDAHFGNDSASKRTYALVGGTGIGTSVPLNQWPFCSPGAYPWY